MRFGEKSEGGGACFLSRGHVFYREGGSISKGGHVSSFERVGAIGMGGPLAWGGGGVVWGSKTLMEVGCRVTRRLYLAPHPSGPSHVRSGRSKGQIIKILYDCRPAGWGPRLLQTYSRSRAVLPCPHK